MIPRGKVPAAWGEDLERIREEGNRQVDHQAGAVAGAGIGRIHAAAGATMREAAQRVQGFRDQAARRPAIHVGDEANTAGAAIPLVRGNVRIERAQTIGCGHECSFADAHQGGATGAGRAIAPAPQEAQWQYQQRPDALGHVIHGHEHGMAARLEHQPHSES